MASKRRTAFDERRIDAQLGNTQDRFAQSDGQKNYRWTESILEKNILGGEYAMKYFLTGATGFVGGRVARQLCAAGHELITLAHTIQDACIEVAGRQGVYGRR